MAQPVSPYRIQKVTRAYHATDTIPWESAPVVATCTTVKGLTRRYAQERETVTHDHGNAWSGHVRAIDAEGRVIAMTDLRDFDVFRVAE